MAGDSVQDTLDYNARAYRDYYRGSRIGLRYDLRYRSDRVARLLREAGVDLGRPGFAAFEYGFGGGHMLQVVAAASRVVGLEASSSAVERAKQAAPPGHPAWEIGQWDDATQLPFDDGSFDLVTASHVLEHLEDDEAALTEWTRLIKPGGHLLVLLPSNEKLFPGTKHLRTYEVSQFCQRLRARGLEQVRVDEHQRFDWPFKHRYLIMASRRSKLAQLLVDAPRTLAFLPAQLVSSRLLDGLDAALASVGAPSCSVAYLFRKP